MGINIQKTGINEWLLDIRVRKAGREIRKRVPFQGTKNSAQEKFLELKKEMRKEAFYPSAPTLKNFRDVLALYRKRREDLGHVDEVRYRQIDNDLGEVPLPQFPDRLQAYIRHLRTNPSKHFKRPLSNASINRIMALVRTSFNLAVDLELLDKSPINKARFPKLKEVARDRVLCEGEKFRLIDTIRAEAPHILPLTRYALQVPCRLSELLNMRREDLDLINNCIRVRNGTTKNDQGVDKPIPPGMLDYFRSIPPESEYLFFREETGRYVSIGWFRKSWVKCLTLAGIQNFRFHDTRHMAATALLDNGTPEQVVLTVAGWKTNMLRTYYHRDGKKSLALVRFGLESGHKVDIGSKYRVYPGG